MKGGFNIKCKLLKIIKKAVIVTLLAVVIFLVLIANWIPFNRCLNERTVTVTVTDKKEQGLIKDDYYIYTLDEDGETQIFEISNPPLAWRFYQKIMISLPMSWNSSDLYDKIEVGNTYKFTICGYRWELVAMFPNLYEVELLE